MSKTPENIAINALLREALAPLQREIAWHEPMTKPELEALRDAARKLETFTTSRLEAL